MADPRRRVQAAALLLLVLLAPACATKTTAEQAAIDQEIARNILWRYREDRAGRFRDVLVTCVDRLITIEGRVSDAKSAADALQIAMTEARGGKVDSKLSVRQR